MTKQGVEECPGMECYGFKESGWDGQGLGRGCHVSKAPFKVVVI